MRKLQLGEHEVVVAVVPESSRGPGWTNEVVFVYVRDLMTGKIDRHSLQLDEQSADLKLLFQTAAVMHVQLLWAVNALVAKKP